jgi:predicted SpoU family rRNA methylase
MDRDAGFAAHVMEQARIRGGTVITIDGSEPVESVVSRVVSHFGLDGN